MTDDNRAATALTRATPSLSPPHSCEDDGHEWRHIRTVEHRGESVSLYRCVHCGEEDVS